MTTILHGNTWLGDDSPTTGVVACQQWIKPTTGEIFYRDTTNAIWTPFGNVNNNLGGAVNVAGDTMTGPLLDAPNLPPLDSPQFIGTIDQDGFPVALKIDLANLSRRIFNQISSQVRSQFLSQFQQSAVAANIAAYNTFTTISMANLQTGGPGLAIPLPTFKSDGAVATVDQLLFYGWSVVGMPVGNSNPNAGFYIWEVARTPNPGQDVSVNVPGSRLLKIWHQNVGSGVNFQINTWAFAVR